AMEPVHWGRDDRPVAGSTLPGCRRNGARPLGTGRRPGPTAARGRAPGPTGDRPLGTGRRLAPGTGPQGETCRTRVTPTGRGRNGARPLGTGRPRLNGDQVEIRDRPQWSPSTGDGTTTP